MPSRVRARIFACCKQFFQIIKNYQVFCQIIEAGVFNIFVKNKKYKPDLANRWRCPVIKMYILPVHNFTCTHV
jgi:hypothetical protein